MGRRRGYCNDAGRFRKMEYLMSLQHDRLGEFIYSPVEKHMIPDAPIGYLYDTLHADAGYENTAK